MSVRSGRLTSSQAHVIIPSRTVRDGFAKSVMREQLEAICHPALIRDDTSVIKGVESRMIGVDCSKITNIVRAGRIKGTLRWPPDLIRGKVVRHRIEPFPPLSSEILK